MVRRMYRGGMNIQRWYQVSAPTVDNRPEDWVCSVTEAQNAGLPPIVGEGLSYLADDQAVSLRDLVHNDPVGLLGRSHLDAWGKSLGLLVKVIDSADRLSIQVHPDKTFAREFLASRFGKTEAWYVIDAQSVCDEPPYLLVGFKAGVTRQMWSQLFWEQRVPEMLDCLNRVTPSPGEVFLIEGGTPHAIGPGCFLVEAQEPTDFTFRAEWTAPDGTRIDERLIHYGLGFERVLDCFHYDVPVEGHIVEREVLATKQGNTETILLGAMHTDRFSMRELHVGTELRCTSMGCFSSILVVAGSGAIEWEGGSVACRPGDRFFLPHALEEFSAVNGSTDTEFRMIRCCPPQS